VAARDDAPSTKADSTVLTPGTAGACTSASCASSSTLQEVVVSAVVDGTRVVCSAPATVREGSSPPPGGLERMYASASISRSGVQNVVTW
jgi:hypothetical protein